MPLSKWHRYLVEARYNLTGFIKAKALIKANAKSVYRFIWRQIICQYSLPGLIIINRGSENKGEVKKCCKDLNILRIQISAYNARANGINENGHLPIAGSLAKGSDLMGQAWTLLLPLVLFADRTTIRRSHGLTPFYLLYRYKPVLPIEVEIPTWRILDWSSDMTPSDHLLQCVRMLERKEIDVEAAAHAVTEFRKMCARERDAANAYRMRPANAALEPGDLVLVYDNAKEINRSVAVKLTAKWQGPFIVAERSAKGVYRLQTPDGVPVAGTFPPTHLKHFFKTDQGYWMPTEGEKRWMHGHPPKQTLGPAGEEPVSPVGPDNGDQGSSTGEPV